MTTSIQPRQEVFPGYELAERIGSGGYAEVWRARAPGGIDKAVKIVFGCYDDQLAVQELKSLERIKYVRHPFVLSLERFEIVDGRLAILTELADMSLEQRAQQCRTQGLPGIPREELLQFISDTAEALDFLAERHSLLHLDIKPANLLISGDHVKVADFGLVKELASCTQNSMVAGMTPTYSSPEMFDDAPSPFSDQYSLAIVYQEMLTGALPFPGRTTAQLANQHLRSQPQLAALNEADRPHVARALAKNPTERFASCREFVRALKGVAAVAATCGVASKPNDLIETSSSDRSHSDRATADCSTQQRPHGSIDTKSDVKPAPKAPPEVIVDIEVPEVKASTTTPPTLYVAVGGVGIRILNRLRDRLALRANSMQNAPAVDMMAIDTDRAELKTACSADWTSPLSAADTLFLPLKLPQVYRDQGSNLEWLSHRWLYNIPRSLETRSYRPLGRLALVDHADKVLQLIDRKLSQLDNGTGSETPAESAGVRVVLIAGMAGGTGGGMAIDLANAVRSRVVQSARRAQVHGLFVCTCLGNASVAPLAVANTVAVLNELRHVSASGNLGAKVPSGSSQQFESQQRPFDLAYVVKAVHHAEQATDDGLDLIAKQLALSLTSGAGQVLETCQQTTTPRELARAESQLLRTFGSAPLAGPKQNRIDRLARSLAKSVEQRWLTNAAPSEWRRLERLGEAENMLNRANLSNAAGENAKAAAPPEAPPQPPAVRWRERFGKQSTTQFAHEVVSRLCKSSRQGETPSTALSSNPEKFIDCALQAIAAINHAANQSVHSEALSEEDDVILNKLSSHDRSPLTRLIDEIEQMSADFTFDLAKVDRIVTAYCVAAVEEFLGLAAGGSNSATHADAQHALASADIDLLQCGYDRRTIIFVPSQNQQSAAPDAVAGIRPQAAKITAEVDEPIVFCEGSGINPASLTRGFERVYPGIGEAAGRLFTRTDIDWS